MSRRAIAGTVVLVAVIVAIVLLVSGGSGGGGYVVRAVFDDGAYMVSGEQVRVAGANVGTIESVSVSRPGETVAYRHGKPVAVPGKAIMVMNISDPSFQDFRQDASCLIRPQSLIGEKFVDCRPTLPRAPGSPAPPSLKQIPEGQPGEGQYLLPLGSNSTSVDPDLINDIQTLPYAQRFRLILNELGGGLAGRGKDIDVLVKRANPLLRDVDRLFGQLSAQRDQLAQLASDSEEILRPLSRARAHVAGFLSNSGAAAQASAEEGSDLEASFHKFPQFLREFRSTMHSLQGFSEAGTPLLTDLGQAAPSLTDATRTLAPFSDATTTALKSLGKAGEEAGPQFAEAVPVVSKSAELAKSGLRPTRNLASLFTNLKTTGGWGGLVSLIYNSAASFNGFDQYGHFGRTKVTLSTCLIYEIKPAGLSSCVARFTGPNAGGGEEEEGSASGVNSTAAAASIYNLLHEPLSKRAGGTAAEGNSSAKTGATTGLGQATAAEGAANAATSRTGGTAPLLDYLLGQ